MSADYTRKIPSKCLIIGDSMLQKIKPDVFDNDAYIFAYPGIRAKQLANTIKTEVLPPPGEIALIFCHVGTNNVTTRGDLSERDDTAEPYDVAKDIISVIDMLHKHYEYAHLVVSAVLPRLDPWKLGDEDRVMQINQELHKFVNQTPIPKVTFVDFTQQFLSNRKLRKECFQFFYSRQLDESDLCHLSDDGVTRLQESMKVCLSSAMNEAKSKWSKDAKILPKREWEEFRRRTFRTRDNPRFKVTNYEPSQRSYERFIKSNPRAADPNGDPNTTTRKSGGGFNISELLLLKDDRKIEREMQKLYPSAVIETIELDRNTHESVAEFPTFGISTVAKSAIQSKLDLKQKLEKLFARNNS